MTGSLRQSMTWLHTWSSITAGWILFAIFLTGTLSFFRNEISYWMQPELHQSVPNEQSVIVAYDYLTEHAAQANEWQISLPDARKNTLDLSWTTPGEARERRRGPRVQLDASTGEPLEARQTEGGNFLYRFHFELYGMPREVARWLVGIVSMMMFVGIISGVIMHRKIFTDFFMFRPGKKLLSWIDGHAISAVLALPFHIMITFSGLILLGNTLMPWNGEGHHGGPRDRGAGGGDRPAAVEVAKDFDDNPPFDKMFRHFEQQWQVPVDTLSISKPGTNKVTYTLGGGNRTELSAGRGGETSFIFDGNGEQISTRPANSEENTAQAVYNYFDMLHQARFADTPTRWLLFFAGILGTIMVGTGSVLWAVKRSKQQMGQFGFELIRGLNVGTIAGLMTACGSYFWANRLLSAVLASRSGWEINIFFIVWAMGIVGGLIWRDRKGWLVQLSLAGTLFTLLPILDSITSSTSVFFALNNADWMRLSFDISCLLIAAVLWLSVYYLAVQKKGRRGRNVPASPAPKRKVKPLKTAGGEA